MHSVISEDFYVILKLFLQRFLKIVLFWGATFMCQITLVMWILVGLYLKV